ncbi:MAG: hypothetical protein WC686_02170 [Candidatus Shapirobacteria bacterium]
MILIVEILTIITNNSTVKELVIKSKIDGRMAEMISSGWIL